MDVAHSVKRFALVGLAAGLLALGPLGRAEAHVGPDPDVDNRYIKIDVSQDLARVVYTLYYADVGALGERRTMDRSGDGQLDDQEQQAYGDRLAAEVARTLRLELDEKPVDLTKVLTASVGIGVPSVAAGSFSIDLEMKLPLRAGAHSLYFDHAWEPPRPGETEVFIQAEPGLRVVEAHAGKQGKGVQTRMKWTGSSAAAGDDRSLLVRWVSAEGTAGDGGDEGAGDATPAPTRLPWWLALSRRPDLGAAAVGLAFVIVLLLGAMDSAAPARLAALARAGKGGGRDAAARQRLIVAPVWDALARSLVVGVLALPLGRAAESVAEGRPGQTSLVVALAVTLLGVGTVALALRKAAPPALRAGDDALRTAVRSPAIWAALLLVAYFARASLSILFVALFAAGNLLASAMLAAATAKTGIGEVEPRLTRPALMATGGAIAVFGLGLAALAARAM